MTDVIADLPRDDRPRERLLMHGAATLSNAELVAILLGSGVRGKNAIQLARELLKDGVKALSRKEVNTLAEIRGVGPAKATRVAAAFELRRRAMDGDDDIPEPPDYDTSILGPALVATMVHHVQERLGVVLLDAHHRVLKNREVYVGTIRNALVSTRDIIRFALFENGVGIVLYHNHPSNGVVPSAHDVTFTEKMKHSLELVDLDLVDHLIIGTTKYYSMRDNGLIPRKSPSECSVQVA